MHKDGLFKLDRSDFRVRAIQRLQNRPRFRDVDNIVILMGFQLVVLHAARKD